RGIQIERAVVTHDDRPLQQVLELADVARPGVLLHLLDDGRGKGMYSPAARRGEACDEVPGEKRDVFPAVAQRRHRHGKHAEAEVEGAAKAAGRAFLTASPDRSWRQGSTVGPERSPTKTARSS